MKTEKILLINSLAWGLVIFLWLNVFLGVQDFSKNVETLEELKELQLDINEMQLRELEPICCNVSLQVSQDDFSIDRPYINNSYNCVNFSQDLHKKLNEMGIANEMVTLRYHNNTSLHRTIAVIIEAQSGRFIKNGSYEWILFTDQYLDYKNTTTTRRR